MVYDPGPVLLLRSRLGFRYSPDQPRDDHGRFGEGGSDSAAFDSATTGSAALSSAGLTAEPTQAQAAALNRMGGDGSYVVNSDLRTQGGDTSRLSDRNAATVEQMDSLMASSPLKEDMVLYRHVADSEKTFGQHIDSTVADVTGLSWRDHAYTSTSVDPRGGKLMEMRILVPKGTPGLSHSLLDPDEVLLGRGLTFTVVKDHGPTVTRHLDVVVSQ